MGRKSLARERRTQILEAFEACIIERGLQGASIAAVAEKAGLDRTLVHHYFGNREALEAALMERVESIYLRQRDEAFASLSGEDRARVALDFLFSPGFGDPRMGILFDELFSAANRTASTKASLLRAYELFEQLVQAEVEKAYPEAPARQRRDVAYSLICLAETASRFNRLGFPEARRRAVRASAEALVRTLVPHTKP